ncbi:hypothetical protein SAMN02910280_0065 [Ruminococcus flavefaciens]|uniref:Uncharacterized protein n=2 Tax=Ruminococcus flavefaciens TaxID=1265 RepID=A0A1K1PRH0_RUMFL|nr:hypothetical protein SAMN02910280_0065 [Ruminococcus flavefaciens]
MAISRIYFVEAIWYNRLQETKKELYTVQKEIIDSDTYRKIKKMNREKLTKFILQYGDELLGEQVKTIDLPALEAELSKIKGIGDKRLKEIMVVIEKFLDV